MIITPWNITSKWLSYLPLLLHEKWRRKYSVISLVILTVSYLDSCLIDASWYKHYLSERSIMCRSAIQDMKCFLVSFWTRNLRTWFYYHCESIEKIFSIYLFLSLLKLLEMTKTQPVFYPGQHTIIACLIIFPWVIPESDSKSKIHMNLKVERTMAVGWESDTTKRHNP